MGCLSSKQKPYNASEISSSQPKQVSPKVSKAYDEFGDHVQLEIIPVDQTNDTNKTQQKQIQQHKFMNSRLPSLQNYSKAQDFSLPEKTKQSKVSIEQSILSKKSKIDHKRIIH